MRHLELWEMDDRREKLLLLGDAALSAEELLAVLLSGRDEAERALVCAQSLLERHGDLAGLRRASLSEMAALPGMSLSKACTIAVALEMGARAQVPRTRRFAVEGAQSVFEFYAPRLSHLSHERFHAMCLDARHLLLRDALVTIGGSGACSVTPREALVEAVRLQSHAVIFVHNHPSGDPTPSRRDLALTYELKRAGDLMGIRVVDHVVIGEGRFVSMASEGLLDGG